MRKRGKNFKAQAYWADFSFLIELEINSTGELARYKILIPQETRADIINYGNWQQIKEVKGGGAVYILDWSRYKTRGIKTPKKLFFNNFVWL